MRLPAFRFFVQRNAAAIALLICAACVTSPPAPPEPSPVATQEALGLRAAPEVSGPEAKAQSQKLATQDALDLLQKGDEAAAKEVLDRALRLDSTNELARKLLHQIEADALKELGSASFSYTVQPDDTLSKLAQRFLNDRYRFYILAKYNDMRVPNRLSAGQVIRIPGSEPPRSQTVTKPHAKAAEPTPRPSEPPPAAKPAAKAPDQPVAAPVAKTKPVPAESEAEKRKTLIQRYLREAEESYRRQDLDSAIRKWDQVLQLDTENQQAKLKRENAARLKENIKKF